MKDYKGSLDFVNNNMVRGWAMNANSTDQVEVSLYVNEQLIISKQATNFRKDLLEKKIHFNGNCGFQINIPDGVMDENKQNKVQVLISQVDVELRNSPQFFCFDDYLVKTKEKVEHQLKDDLYKILIVGLPKSGTSILTYTLGDLFEDKIIYFEPKGNHGLSDVEFHQNVVVAKKNIVTKSLFFSDIGNKLEIIDNFYNKKIWIYRDPRDWMMSEFFYCWYKAHNPNPTLFKQALKLVEEKENNPSKVPFYEILSFRPNFKNGIYENWINKFTKKLEELPNDWFLLKYENFVDGNYNGLNQYLGKELTNQSQVPDELSRVVRTKKYGNWRRWFTLEDVKFFKPLYKDALEKLGYDSEDWDLTPCKTLPKEEGSKYMKKMYGI